MDAPVHLSVFLFQVDNQTQFVHAIVRPRALSYSQEPIHQKNGPRVVCVAARMSVHMRVRVCDRDTERERGREGGKTHTHTNIHIHAHTRARAQTC